jgi:hypothetical protein
LSTALPLGLAWDDLPWAPPGEGEWLEVATGRRGPLTGGGNTAVLSVVSGDGVRRAVFAKRTVDPIRREGGRHRALAGRVPLPRLLAVVERDDAEVIVLEHLPQIGVGPGHGSESGTRGSSTEVDFVLELSASLARVTDADPDVFPEQPGMDQNDFEAALDKTLRGLADSGFPVAPARWLQVYRTARCDLAGFPRALSHGEFALQQLGRTAAGELVMFDLETCFERARFTDPATVLRSLSRLGGESERSLLGRWCSAAGLVGDADRQWQEFLTTRVVVAVETLPWLASESQLEPHLHELVDQVNEDLAQLG